MIHIEAEGVEGLLARARAGTDHVHLVDGGADRQEAFDHFAESLHFPDYFGHNLDALMDCLRDVAERHHDAWTLVWRPGAVGVGAEPDGGTDPGILGVLSSLEEEYPDVSIVVADR